MTTRRALHDQAFSFGATQQPLRKVDIQDYLDNEKEYREPRMSSLEMINMKYPPDCVNEMYDQFWTHDNALCVLHISHGVESRVPEKSRGDEAFHSFRAEMRSLVRHIDSFELARGCSEKASAIEGLQLSIKGMIDAIVVVARLRN